MKGRVVCEGDVGQSRITKISVFHAPASVIGHVFDEIDVLAMRAIASQLAGAIGNARLLIGKIVHRAEQFDILQRLESAAPLIGQIASHGLASAPVTVYDHRSDLLEAAEADSDSKYSLSQFHGAVRKTTEQLQELQFRFSQRLAEGASLIFAAHLMILTDKRFTRDGVNPGKFRGKTDSRRVGGTIRC